MSISLEEASKLSTDILLRGIIETIIKDSPILERLPFIQIVGNSLKYNREKTLPTVGWYAPVTGTWTTSEPAFEQCSASLCVLGGDADVDNFLKATRSNIQDLEAAVIELKAKALRNEFENTFLNGDSSQDANQPDGLYKTLKGTAWEATTAYSLGDIVVPTTGKAAFGTSAPPPAPQAPPSPPGRPPRVRPIPTAPSSGPAESATTSARARMAPSSL
jgi:HK97 family phage major capsid protein